MQSTADQVSNLRFLGHFYANIMPYRTTGDGMRLCIEGAPFPWKMVLVLNVIYVLFFGGWIYLCLRFAAPHDRILAIAAGTSIGTLVCVGVTGTVIAIYRRATAKGPLLIYDGTQKTVTLPRVSRCFAVADVRLQWLNLVGPQRESDGGSELQLLASPAGGAPETFLLLATNLRIGLLQKSLATFDRMLWPIMKLTPIQVVSVPMNSRTEPRAVMPYPM